MRIDLAGWSSHGLRTPDIDINLLDSDGKPAKVALIQMPNGTGKTTTLELIKATLSNSAENWKPEDVRKLRRRRDARPEGQFIVRLLVNGRPLTFELTLDFDNGTTRIRTTTVGSGGIVNGWKPSPEVRQFLSPAFLRLFIFDGEFADELFDPSKAEADRAIDALCQLYLLGDAAEFAESEWDRKSKAAGPRTDSAKQRYQNEQNDLLKRREELRTIQRNAAKSIERDLAAIAELETKISQHLLSMETTKTEYAQAEQTQRETATALLAATSEAMSSIRMPLSIHQKFGSALINLKENLNLLRLPENTSAQFFEELVNEGECICGRMMTDGAREEITIRSKRYLDVAESGTINMLKADIDRFTTHLDQGKPLDQRLAVQLKRLGAASRGKQQADQLVRLLKQKLIDAGDEQFKNWQAQLVKHEQNYLGQLGLLEDIEGEGNPDASVIFSLKQLERKLAEVTRKIADITDTVRLRKETDLLKNILVRASELARVRIKEELINQANDCLRDILINDPLEISEIDRSLRLVDQDGASVGQTLSVGYTFLMSVLNRGHNNFPLVVDSPANPIDEDVRRNIGKLIPSLCTQFLAFTINTERPGFVPALEAASDSIKYLTMFRKTDGTQRLMAGLPEKGVTQTETAVLIEDREYFMNFGVETQEGE